LPHKTILSFDLSVQAFEEIVRPDLEAKFKDFLNDDNENGFFKRNKIKGRDVSQVILVGGSSKLPWLADIMAEICPKAGVRGQIHKLDEPEMSVAYGAALYNYYLQVDELPIPIILQDTLKLGVKGKLYILAKKNTPLPYEPAQLHSNHSIWVEDVRSKLEIRLYIGDGEVESECTPLGEPREIDFEQKLHAKTLLTCQIHIDKMGHVELTILPIFKQQMAQKITFPTLRVS